MEKVTNPDEVARPWTPMRLSYVSSVGELMRNTLGSRKDNPGGGTCQSTGRQIGGTNQRC